MSTSLNQQHSSSTTSSSLAPSPNKESNQPGNPDPDTEVIALSPKTLMAINKFICEVCNKGFQREQNLRLHRRGHNLPWELNQETTKEVKKKVYLCPETTCVHHDPSMAFGDLTGIKKHFLKKHGEKKWKCDKCSKKYAVQSDWEAHSKTCGTEEYRCDCGTLFSRRDSFITHRAFCEALPQERARLPTTLNSIKSLLYGNNNTTPGLRLLNLAQLPSSHNIGPSSAFRPPQTLSAASGNFFGGGGQMGESSNNNVVQDYGHDDHKYPINKTFHGLMELPDHHQLLLNSCNQQQQSLFSNQLNPATCSFSHENRSRPSNNIVLMSTTHVPSLSTCPFETSTSTTPHMSATALLQKAAQIGSTSSNNNSQFGGVTFMENEPNNNKFQDLMNSVLSDEEIRNISSIFGHARDYDDGPKVNIENSDRLTRDFLGVGHIMRNMNGGGGGGFSQQQGLHGIGAMKTKSVRVQKSLHPVPGLSQPSSAYVIPETIKEMIKINIVPQVLTRPLTPQTYKDFFTALLYAEDFYIEKWKNFEVKNVSVEMHPAYICNKSSSKKKKLYKNKKKNVNDCEEKDFVAIKLDSLGKNRPFLLSRDLVFLRPSGSNVEPFQGIIYQVEKSSRILVDFEDRFQSFHHQHHYSRKYDIRFSFNRVCLKRAHQAIASASDQLFRDLLFPASVSRNLTSPEPYFPTQKLGLENMVVRQLLTLKCPPPYLIEGPLCVTRANTLSKTGLIIQEAVIQTYRARPESRILITAPVNATCDILMRYLKAEIPETDIFLANAAFREPELVLEGILSSCPHSEECFTYPSLLELQNFKVILSTYMSSYRLCAEGLKAGHFSHVFLVDASGVTEPEAMVTVAHLVSDETAVIVTGAPNNRCGWVRSDISRSNGLMRSYFERLAKSESYSSLDPRLIRRL